MIELLGLLIEGGSSAVIIWMLLDMRTENKRQREQIWAMLDYLVRRHDDGPPLG